MEQKVERELVLAAPLQELWEFVTSPGWLAEEVELELRAGGEARFGSGERSKTGWVEEARAPDEETDSARLVFWWSEPDEPATRVELLLEPAGLEATRLRVIESRPLESLDILGIPLPESGESSPGPAMLSLA
jgi:hypothetical protein